MMVVHRRFTNQSLSEILLVHPLADVFYGVYYVIKRWKVSASYPDYMIVSTRKLAPSSSKVTGTKKQSGMFC